MKLNNKGFAISSVLYGLLAVLILILMLIFAIMRSSSNNSKELATAIEKQVNACRTERIVYNNTKTGTSLASLNACLLGVRKQISGKPANYCLDEKTICNKTNTIADCQNWTNNCLS